jgi:hypothetical protein
MERTAMLNEIRYAERLCDLTARLYRRLQAISTFMAILGGSAVASSLGRSLPHWVSIAGVLVMTAFGAFGIVARPAEKAAANKIDARRYAELRTRAVDLSDVDLERALAKARESDADEIELLRDVAWNDVAAEIGRSDAVSRLTLAQRALRAMA